MDTKKITTSEPSNDAKREKVRVIPIQFFDDFPKHPFNVKMDADMEALIESIKEFGILTPLIGRKKENDRYEIIAGHRRKFAAKKIGFTELPVILREMTRDEAVIAMVDSNLHRERILPSEKARSYKMKMDALKRQGKRTDLTSVPFKQKSKTTRALVAEESGESPDQIRRYVRLNELTTELLDFVDEGKIGIRSAVELSYLHEDEMRDLVDFIDDVEVFPSLAQSIRMKSLSKEGKLDTITLRRIMFEIKPNQKPQIKIALEKIERYFPTGTLENQMVDIIVQALAMYRQMQKEID